MLDMDDCRVEKKNAILKSYYLPTVGNIKRHH